MLGLLWVKRCNFPRYQQKIWIKIKMKPTKKASNIRPDYPTHWIKVIFVQEKRKKNSDGTDSRIYWSFPVPKIHCARWVKYGSAWELLLSIGARLWSSALNSLSNLLQYRVYRGLEKVTKTTVTVYDHVRVPHPLQTYRIASVKFGLLELIDSAWHRPRDLDGLGFSDRRELINHWVAEAYCRQSDFSLSTFCISENSQ